MAESFYDDSKDIQFYFNEYLKEDLKRVVDLKENFYENLDQDADAPTNFDEALDTSKSILQYVGEICEKTIAPNGAEVDRTGATYDSTTKKVKLADGTIENLQVLAESNLMGSTLPRKYGGMNQTEIVLAGVIEMVSRADAGLMTLFGLQGIGETIYHFSEEEVRQKYLPKLASGEYTGAMVLTEADAGSDLGRVRCKAHLDEATGKWYLNGSKRFITNGQAEVMLVLARTEPDSNGDVRGLSMFVVEQSQVVINRIEHKLGINGSPTCEMIFNNSEGILIGKRRFGLVKYIIQLMNSARLGTAGQGLGVSQAAFKEALKYSDEREQFGTKIRHFPAVASMLTNSNVKIEALRALIYRCSLMVDMYSGLEKRADILKEKLVHATAEQKELWTAEKQKCTQDAKLYRMYADVLTPLAKMRSGTTCNEVASDAVQVLGGSGYTTEFNVERYFRDARIVDIYEGTGQLQVKAAISGVLNGYLKPLMDEIANKVKALNQPVLNELLTQIEAIRGITQDSIEFTKAQSQSPDYEVFIQTYERHLCEMMADTYSAYLLLDQARISDRKKIVCKNYLYLVNSHVSALQVQLKTCNIDSIKEFVNLTQFDM